MSENGGLRELDAEIGTVAQDEYVEEIDIMLYLTPPDLSSEEEIDPEVELERMEAELAEQERQRLAFAALSPDWQDVAMQSPESDDADTTDSVGNITTNTATEDMDDEQGEEVVSGNETESSTEEVVVANVGVTGGVEAMTTSFARLSPSTRANGESSESVRDEGSSNDAMESILSSAESDCGQPSAGSKQSGTLPTSSSGVSSLQDSEEGEDDEGETGAETEGTTEDDTPSEELLTPDHSGGSSSGAGERTTMVASSGVHDEEQTQDEADEQDGTVEIVWSGSTPPWEEDTKANEIDALLVHACQCDAVRHCRDRQFGELCVPMKRFLRANCWASHNDKCIRSRDMQYLTQILSYHSLRCLVRPSTACYVPMCSQLRR